MAYLIISKDRKGKEVIRIRGELTQNDALAAYFNNVQLYRYDKGSFYKAVQPGRWEKIDACSDSR